MKKPPFWVYSAIILLQGCLVQAAIYHVSTGGIDTDVGSEEHPWRTIEKAATTMVAGDQVIVQQGNYDERIVTSRGGTSESSRISYKATGRVVMRGFSVGHPFITVEGFEVTGHSSADVYDGYIEVTRNGDHFRFLTNTVRDGIYLVSPDIVFHDNEPAPDTITCASGGFLAAGFKPGQTIFLQKGTNNVTPANTGTRVITSVSDDTLTVGGSLVDDGPVHAYITGSYVYGLVVLSGATNCLFQGNSFTNLSFDSWFVGGVSNLFEGNTLSYCHGWDLIHFMGDGHVFTKNWLRYSPLVVYQVSPDSTENWPTKYQNIVFSNNFFEGVSAVLSSQKYNTTGSGPLTYVRNVFVDIGRFVGRFPNTTFENNTFLRVASRGNAVISVAQHPLLFTTDNYATNAVIRNNIFVGCGEVQFPWTESTTGWYEFSGPTESVRAEGNFVAGAAPDYGSKLGWGEGDPGLNGGDPGFVNVNDPLGPDRLPFTDDDGLRLNYESKLISAGSGGITIGAYAAPIGGGPNLVVERISADQVRLSWPESASGWQLQGAPTASGTWTNIEQEPTIFDGRFRLDVDISGGGGFFRLKR